MWRVTPEGGTHAFPSGVEVTFPSGAVEVETDVRADGIEHTDLPPPQSGTPAPVGNGFEFDVGGATLVSPVEVATAVPGDGTVDGGIVYLATLDKEHAGWVATGGSNEPGDRLLRGPAFRGGTFAVLEWAGGDVDKAMQPILDAIFVPAPAGVAPPECAKAGSGTKLDAPADAALLTCMEAGNGGGTVKARNNRTYPVTASLPDGATAEPVPAGTMSEPVWRAASAAAGPSHVLIPPGSEALIHLAEIKPGDSVKIDSVVDGLAYTAAILDATTKADLRTAQVVGEADRFQTVVAGADLASCLGDAAAKGGAPLAAADVPSVANAASDCATAKFRASGGDSLVSVRTIAPATKTRLAVRTAAGETVAATYQQQTAQSATASKEKPKPPECDGAAIYSHSIVREDIPDEELPAQTKKIAYSKCVGPFAAVKVGSTLYYFKKARPDYWDYMGERAPDGQWTEVSDMSSRFGLTQSQFDALTPGIPYTCGSSVCGE